MTLETRILENYGLGLFSSSPESYAEALTKAVTAATADGATLVAVVTKALGRSEYHYALVSLHAKPVSKATKVAKDA